MKHSTKYLFFFFNDTATTEIYTLSLHDALPILRQRAGVVRALTPGEVQVCSEAPVDAQEDRVRSEEHTSELQSQSNLVCRLLLEKKKKNRNRLFEAHTSIPAHSRAVCSPTLRSS